MHAQNIFELSEIHIWPDGPQVIVLCILFIQRSRYALKLSKRNKSLLIEVKFGSFVDNQFKIQSGV